MFHAADGSEIPCPDPASGLYIKSRTGEVVRVVIPSDHLAFQIGETSQVRVSSGDEWMAAVRASVCGFLRGGRCTRAASSVRRRIASGQRPSRVSPGRPSRSSSSLSGTRAWTAQRAGTCWELVAAVLSSSHAAYRHWLAAGGQSKILLHSRRPHSLRTTEMR